MTVDMFDSLTPADVEEIIWQNSELEETKFRADAELQRIMTMKVVNTQIKAEYQYSDPMQFFPFPWEREITQEEEQDLIETNWEMLDSIYIPLTASGN